MDRNGPLRGRWRKRRWIWRCCGKPKIRVPGWASARWRGLRILTDIRALLVSGEPLPLVMFDSPCLMRSRAIACLDAAGIRQVVFVSHSLSGIWAAVQAGLGLTIRTRIGMPQPAPAGGLLPAPEVWPSACDKPA